MVMIIKKISIRPILAIVILIRVRLNSGEHDLTPTEANTSALLCVCNIPSESNLSSSCITIEY